jgi:hypothetical protein
VDERGVTGIAKTIRIKRSGLLEHILGVVKTLLQLRAALALDIRSVPCHLIGMKIILAKYYYSRRIPLTIIKRWYYYIRFDPLNLKIPSA